MNVNMAGIRCNNVCLKDKKWIVDSGASQHMSASGSQLVDLVDVSKLNLMVDHPNGTSAKINKIGNMNFSNSVSLTDVFVIPDFHVNLLSIHKLCKENKCKVTFDENHSFVKGSLYMETGKESGGLYYLESQSLGGSKIFNHNSKCFISNVTWHHRLGILLIKL